MTNRRTVILAGTAASLGALGLLAHSGASAQGSGVTAAGVSPTPPPELAADLPTTFGLQLSYLRSLDGKAIAKRSLEEMRRAVSLAPAQEESWLAAMQATFPDVKAGDRITGLHQPGVGARFWFNGLARSAIADSEFSRLFFGIWLAESTSEPRLRSALLAKAAS
jgi:hypothetical protein